MKCNSKLKIISKNLILVPYMEKHVPKYHEWMQSEELQKLTASERLTLCQEYDMQKSWREDEDKCTFIILDRRKYELHNDEIDSMIGDTNIFITDKDIGQGEIEIMLAEESARGKKLGQEAVTIMLLYGIESINLKRYEAKISLTNEISFKMFKKLGFEEESRSLVFQEITLARNVTEEWVISLKAQYPYTVQDYIM
ncbi:unnamed protein product [Leptosia nina]|uniref:N-acetyltransferase domain-containing protein n=1 Tax=Leptosia nina TaxID=320188 RepID=A0AAV1JJ87_9NEOP